MRKWDDLADEEQEDAVDLLHIARTELTAFAEAEDRELFQVAINFIDSSRRKFKVGHDQKEVAERLADKLVDLLRRGNTVFKIEAGFLEGSPLSEDVDKYVKYRGK